MTLNKDVSQIRLNQAQSQAELSSLPNLRNEPPLKHSSSNEAIDVDESELNEEAELQRLLKKLLLNRTIDIQNQLQIYQELTKLEEQQKKRKEERDVKKKQMKDTIDAANFKKYLEDWE